MLHELSMEEINKHRDLNGSFECKMEMPRNIAMISEEPLPPDPNPIVEVRIEPNFRDAMSCIENTLFPQPSHGHTTDLLPLCYGDQHETEMEPAVVNPEENIPSESIDESSQSVSEVQMEEDQHTKKKVGRKRKFTPEEDEQLINLVKVHGEAKWSRIAELMPGRNRKQLRDHYINFLKSKMSEKEFSPAEDAKLVQLLEVQGRSWNRIAQQLPGRSPISIKNRFYTKLKKTAKVQAKTTSIGTIASLNNVAQGVDEVRKSCGTFPTHDRNSVSERGSVEAEIAKKMRASRGDQRSGSTRDSKKHGTKKQITMLIRQKQELQQAYESVTQRINEMKLSSHE